MKTLLRSSVIALVLILVSAPSWGSDLDAVVKGMQGRYGKITDLTADFVQETMVKTLGRKQSAAGEVMFKRPDKMRWDYKTPEKKQLLTDGYSLWIYMPEDRQVFMRKLDAVNSAKVPMMILSGEIDVQKKFKAAIIEKQGDRIWLELVPRQSNPGYDKVRLLLHAATFEVSRIKVWDLYGNVTDLALTNQKTDSQISDSEFVFTPKPGVEVISPPAMEF